MREERGSGEERGEGRQEEDRRRREMGDGEKGRKREGLPRRKSWIGLGQTWA